MEELRMLKDKTVCIVGLGLMGGSLGLALHGKCHRVLGVARRPETVELAVSMGAVDEAAAEMSTLLPRADIAVLATPVRTILALIPRVAQLMRPGTLLTDLGSTKTEIVAAMSVVRGDIDVIGGHPLCGREVSGLEAARSDLYQNKVFVLTPLDRTSPVAVALAQALVVSIGARPIAIQADRHDRLVAAVSHLPYLQSAALATVAGAQAAADSLTWELAATGFRDTSRLAASDVDMMLDIAMTNRANVAALARQAASWLNTMADALESSGDDALRSRLESARRHILAYRAMRAST